MADNYGTVAGADSYHLARGNSSVWDAATVDDDDKLAALLLASEWIDDNYRYQFSGYKTGMRAQVREWPRTNATAYVANYGYEVILSNVVPEELATAAYEVALQQIKSAGSLFKTWTAGKDIKQVSVDGAISVTYAGAGGFSDVQIMLPKITGILAPILTCEAVSNAAGSTYRA